MCDYISYFEKDLNKRINPEQSRHFNRSMLISSMERLFHITKKDEIQPNGIRISIIGSNGKGSTAFSLAKLGKVQSQRVGLFTSPHLNSILERISICDTSLSVTKGVEAKTAWEGLCELKELLIEDYDKLSYFEILTVLAIFLFRKHECNLQVYEAGIGGRFDATKVAQAQNIILTNIEKEHTQLLGENVLLIMKEKLGLIGPQAQNFFHTFQENIQKDVIEKYVKKQNPNIKIFYYKQEKREKKGNYLEQNQKYAEFILKAIGLSYAKNIDSNSPGRLERKNIFVSSKKTEKIEKELIFDTAHNSPAIFRTLQDILLMYSHSVKEYADKTIILLAVLKDRDLAPCLSSVHKAGFSRVWLLTGDMWQQVNFTLYCVNLETLCPLLKKELYSSETKRIIFLGTHRTYPYFQNLYHYFCYLR